jgi:putative hydrolase of the HAD superfamily
MRGDNDQLRAGIPVSCYIGHAMRPLAVTFDFGQTLCDLDTAMLSARLLERGIVVTADRLDAATHESFRAYDAGIVPGRGGHPWQSMMARLLTTAGAPADAIDGAVDWLWSEQPRRNLWRRPVAGMIELCRDLRRAGVGVGVVSNSEGHLAALVAEMGWTTDLPVVADSGALGIEKPDAAIFRWAANRLGVSPDRMVHVGDSAAADVDGALGAGMRAIWFRPRPGRPVAEDVRLAHDVDGVRAALHAWGVGAALTAR